MMTELLKQLSLSVFGLGLGVAVLAASTDTALADRGKARWIDGPVPYTNDVVVKKRGAKAAPVYRTKRNFVDTLDTETEAVWRNLRPTRFSD